MRFCKSRTTLRYFATSTDAKTVRIRQGLSEIYGDAWTAHLMNEIRAESDGKIVKVLVENGEPVEFGQTLYLLTPA